MQQNNNQASYPTTEQTETQMGCNKHNKILLTSPCAQPSALSPHPLQPIVNTWIPMDATTEEKEIIFNDMQTEKIPGNNVLFKKNKPHCCCVL